MTAAHAASNRTGDPEFLADVLAGLSERPRTLPCKYFYDAAGSRLFDAICELDEYYPTRAELEILRAHAPEIAAAIGPGRLLVEYGSGSSTKTRLLLDRLAEPAGYAPVDVSREHLLAAADRVAVDYPGLCVAPIVAKTNSEGPPVQESSRYDALLSLLFHCASSSVTYCASMK